MYDFFLYVAVFDFDLFWPTLFGFLVNCITTWCKVILSNRSVFESTWLRKCNQLLYSGLMNMQLLYKFGSSKGIKGGNILVEFQREVL